MDNPSLTLLKTRNRFLSTAWAIEIAIVLSFVALVVLTSLPLTPSLRPVGRDNGIFAYTAEVVFDGGTLYRDAWDNKLPGVYFIDVLAFHLFGTSAWAIWLIDVIFLCVTAALFFRLLMLTYFTREIALVMTYLFIFLARHPIMVQDVNFTENYALLPQVVVFIAGYRFLRQPSAGWAFTVGISASLAFLLKQTTIGGTLAFIPALMLARHPVVRAPERWKWLATVIAGGLTGLGTAALYLGTNGILTAAIQASIVSPIAFHQWVSAEPISVMDTITRTLTRSVAPAILLLLSCLIVPGVLSVITKKRRRVVFGTTTRDRVTFGGWAALTLIVDLALVNITNRSYAHYYVTLVPALTVLSTIGLHRLVNTPHPPHVLRRRRNLVLAVLAINVVVFCIGVLIEVVLTATGSLFGPAQEHPIVHYVEQNTRSDDTVFVWGASSEINFQAQRHSPTQYHYGYPLIVPGPTAQDEIAELIGDLSTAQPALIVDTTLEDGNRIPPLNRSAREQWWQTNGRQDVSNLTPLFEFVESHCWEEYQNGEGDVTVYRCAYGEATAGVPQGAAPPTSDTQ